MVQDYTNRKSGATTQSEVKSIDQGLRSYMNMIYNHMGLGLVLTGIVAFAFANTAALRGIMFSSQITYYLFMFAPLAYVLIFSSRIYKMTPKGATLCFYGFATVMGASLSWIFIAFQLGEVARAFFITAAAFGGLSLYGYVTKKDLTAMGRFMMMGLIGIIIASIVNIFMKSSGMDFAISAIGVLVFAGLTAYDTQKAKNRYYTTPEDKRQQVAIISALELYLDFINLMIMILRLLSNRN